MPERSRVDVDDNFEKRVTDVMFGARETGAALSQSGATSWVMPEPAALRNAQQEAGESPDDLMWNGSLFDLENIGISFNRDDLSERFQESVTDAENPGVSGDLISATAQIDYLGTMERAFRARHTMRRPRAMAHAAGRMLGHGHPSGVLATTALDYVTDIVKQAKRETP